MMTATQITNADPKIIGRKAVWGWALYDWANSAFATTVMAGFFPIFFKTFWSHGVHANLSTARLGFANAVAGLIVALMAPVLGAIADAGSARKKFLIFFAYQGALMAAALFWIPRGGWQWAAAVYVLGVIGFSGANIFYDALLPLVSDEDRIDYVSGFGYALGYLGGGLLFLVNVIMTVKPHLFGLADAAQAIRYSFLSVAVWWGGFTVLTILWLPKEKSTSTGQGVLRTIRQSLNGLMATLKTVGRMKTVLLFLLAYWFYIDGVHTIIRMAVDYGIALGFETDDLITALLMVQFIGFPAALLFGKLGQRWGARKGIFWGLWIYFGVTLWATRIDARHEFYILAAMIGLAQGGVQALSRSFYTRLIPQNRSAEFFGFYNMLGKFAVIIGPALMGIAGLWARSIMLPSSPTPQQLETIGQLASRWSIASVALLFLIGGVLFYFVDERKGRHEVNSQPPEGEGFSLIPRTGQ